MAGNILPGLFDFVFRVQASVPVARCPNPPLLQHLSHPVFQPADQLRNRIATMLNDPVQMLRFHARIGQPVTEFIGGFAQGIEQNHLLQGREMHGRPGSQRLGMGLNPWIGWK